MQKQELTSAATTEHPSLSQGAFPVRGTDLALLTLSSGAGLSLFLDTAISVATDTPEGSVTFFALVPFCFAAAGVMSWRVLNAERD